MTLGAATRKAEKNGGIWLPGHLWRPNGPPDYGIGEGEDTGDHCGNVTAGHCVFIQDVMWRITVGLHWQWCGASLSLQRPRSCSLNG